MCSQGRQNETVEVKHAKIAAKTGGLKYQYQIMKSIGIPEEDIPK